MKTTSQQKWVEYGLLAVSVVAAISFGPWLKAELRHAAETRRMKVSGGKTTPLCAHAVGSRPARASLTTRCGGIQQVFSSGAQTLK
ncbi:MULTISPECIES: hypothetical protein [unclassified Caballeronia]|uniref:hypothetical protein n=1 Tax=unclassified Caballeronia TaxID=2646786 RepID=UPI002864BA9C|nr:MULTISPECIES: hypothetical protein [unclassified Caballeronia]MDR5755185.1 hypothetical protein [Caballeronia sp. LZ024]MDR5845036.1 hypothetical protein [Caballeronia sp. LZ031]